MWSRCEPTGPTLLSCYIHQLPDGVQSQTTASPAPIYHVVCDCGDFPTASARFSTAPPNKNSDFWNCASKRKECLHPLNILLVVFVFPLDNAGKPSGSPLTLDDLFDRNFQVHDPGAKWINGKEKCAVKERDFPHAAVPENNNANNNNQKLWCCCGAAKNNRSCCQCSKYLD